MLDIVWLNVMLKRLSLEGEPMLSQNGGSKWRSLQFIGRFNEAWDFGS